MLYCLELTQDVENSDKKFAAVFLYHQFSVFSLNLLEKMNNSFFLSAIISSILCAFVSPATLARKSESKIFVTQATLEPYW